MSTSHLARLVEGVLRSFRRKPCHKFGIFCPCGSEDSEDIPESEAAAKEWNMEGQEVHSPSAPLPRAHTGTHTHTCARAETHCHSLP